MSGKVQFILCLWLASLLSAVGAEAPGIVCVATDGERSVAFVTATPDFTLTADQSIHPQLKPNFHAEWSGFLRIERAGNYRLILTDGKSVLGQQTLKSDVGLMPVNLTFDRKPGLAQQQLWWESDFFRPEPVPWRSYVQTNVPPEAQTAARSERGRQLVEDLNCMACHKTDNRIFRGRTAPDLSNAGLRLKKEWIFHWLADPKSFRPNAAMPNLGLTSQERADVATYLSTLRATPEATAAAASTNLDARALYDQIGCAGCHGPNGSSLTGVGSKYQSAAALAKYLADPLACDASGRMPGMLLTAGEAEALAEFLIGSKNTAFEQPAPAGDIMRGKAVMLAKGCANCHEVRDAGAKLETRLNANPLTALKGGGGCLANDGEGKTPNYQLADEDRAALSTFLASEDVSPAPAQDIERWLAQFQCTACHAWHGPASLPFGRDQEPPALTDTGNKLRRSWIEAELTTTNRDRPWLKTRMPLYGPENVAGFFDDFAGAAGNTLGEGAIIDNPRVDLADEGMHYLGNDDEGLSCLTCHAFRGEPSHGDLHSPDLTTVDARVRTDWLQRWLFEPSRIAPGTAMPDFFATKPSAEAEKEVHRLLQALAMGPKMPDPPGWHGDPRTYFIVVSNTPVVQRCFLPDASPRAIAVGLPGGVSYVFDAASCEVKYAWTGDFLDAKPTWTWRGGLPPRVLGKKFYVAPNGPGLQVGSASANETSFRGYELEKGYPKFKWEIGGATVTLAITVGKNELVCAYHVQAAGQGVQFTGGPAMTVTADSTPQRDSDGSWRLPGKSQLSFVARTRIP